MADLQIRLYMPQTCYLAIIHYPNHIRKYISHNYVILILRHIIEHVRVCVCVCVSVHACMSVYDIMATSCYVNRLNNCNGFAF